MLRVYNTRQIFYFTLQEVKDSTKTALIKAILETLET